MKGLVTSIQSMCYDDGTGLRTTVFFKGCPLRCFWCHNPESLKVNPHIAYYAAKCISCGNCVKICRAGARKQAGGFADPKVCALCGQCADVCPTYALEKIGTEWEAKALAESLARDRGYFERSGGGVTLSGGEPLLQWEFALELLTILQDMGIHTAIETSGFAGPEVFAAVTAAADLVIMDLKHHENSVHKQVTDVENTRILENFRYLAKSARPCIIRTPVIPGVNDTPEDILKIAQIAAGAKGLLYYELMPYHALGTGKLKSLGREPGQALTPPAPEQMEELRGWARKAGIVVK